MLKKTCQVLSCFFLKKMKKNGGFVFLWWFCPCGGRKRCAFSSVRGSYPDSGRESAIGRQSAAMHGDPFGGALAGAKTPLALIGFLSFWGFYPVMAENQRLAGRVPSCGDPCGGVLAGAKTPLALIGFLSLWGFIQL
jgi:hypothetical protein